MHASQQRATRALVTLCAGVAGTLVLTASPSLAEPSVDEARERLSTVQEKRDRAATQVRRLSRDVARAQSALRETQNEVQAHEVALAEIEELITAEAEQTLDFEGIAAASDVIRAEDPSEALADARAREQEVSRAPETAEALAARIVTLRGREAAQDLELDRMRATAEKQGAALTDLRTGVASAAEELDDAQARAREAARPTRSAARPSAAPSAPAASSGAAAAIAYAKAQVGDTYVYGAAGPDAFDCSGLTMRAWEQGGVALPRTSQAQIAAGTPVSIDSLQPGDLVAYYSPVSHIGIYVGGGMLAHAANPDTDVELTPVFSMPVSGAVRPG